MKTPVFLTFCLLIVSALVSMHVMFRSSVDPSQALTKRLDLEKKEREAAEIRMALAKSELAEYQQQTAALLPEAIQHGKSEAYPLRQLASVVSEAKSNLEIERASTLFERAKSEFRAKNFDRASSMLKKVIVKYPDSIHRPEAHFLLAEGYYQMKSYQASAGEIERMITLFPENDLTGFALLRLGNIFENEERLEDASDVYRSILANFKEPELVKQANKNLKAASL